MMRIFLAAVLGLLVACTAAVAFEGIRIEPQPPERQTYCWHGDTAVGAVCFYQQVEYFACSFPTDMMGGPPVRVVRMYACCQPMSYSYECSYIHLFSDTGDGLPGEDLGRWMVDFRHDYDVDLDVIVEGDWLLVAVEQNGPQDNADIAVDGSFGFHNLFCRDGNWESLTEFGNFFIGLTIETELGVQTVTWGGLKALW
jgi:hypothetical protein